MRSSTGNGGVSASFSTSSAVAATSISPVGSPSFTVPSGRWRTPRRRAPRTRCAPGARRCRRPARVDHDLHDAGDVAHVEEHDPTVVTAAVDPPADRDLPVDVGAPEIAGAIGTHHRWVSGSVRGLLESFLQPSATSCRGTSTCSLVCMSFTRPRRAPPRASRGSPWRARRRRPPLLAERAAVGALGAGCRPRATR